MSVVHLVELASVAVLAFFVVLEVRSRRWRESLPLGALLVLSAWIGEDTCIRLYEFYEYSPDWHFILDKMPPMVALIWPFVILSDYRVVRGAVGDGSRALPWLTGGLVCLDAALMEPIAVQAGLWRWSEPGLFDVPLIGLLGWGFFAASSLWLWSRLRGFAKLMLLVLAPLLTHALLLGTWWGALRWMLRGPFPLWGILSGAAGVSLLLCVLIYRNGIRVPFETMLPRVFAAGVFFWLLVAYGHDNPGLMAYAVCFVPPYLLATRWPGKRVDQPELEASP